MKRSHACSTAARRASRIFDALTYTEQVVKESMRLFPPVYAIARKAVADTQIGEYPIPAGSEIGIWIYQPHRDPRWFDRPQAFEPERFTDPDSIQRMKNAYLPFGLGARTCIGKTFATIEAVFNTCHSCAALCLTTRAGSAHRPENRGSR